MTVAGPPRLSKIAHMGRLRLQACDAIPTIETLAGLALAGDTKAWSAPFDLGESVTPYEPYPAVVHKPSRLGTSFSRSWTCGSVDVMASQGELEHPKKRFSSILRSLPALATPIGIQPI
jgi:hypothetical protein